MGKIKKKSTKRRSDAEDDDRFVDLAKNPMFREMRNKEYKVAIDDRFKDMLADEAFREDAFLSVDRRGRPNRNLRSDAHLSHIYELKNDEKINEGGELQHQTPTDLETTKSNDERDSNIADDAQQIRLDLARGRGNISSSSDDESTDELLDRQADEDEEAGGESNWEGLDREVRRVEWASSRLAICNLDWTNVRAEDLILLLNSLKPSSGKIHSVSVYLSDFGAECIEKEKSDGPRLKVKRPNKEGKDGERDLEERTKQAIRAHEFDKLRYYYAVCVCDSVETATAIYEQCDGVEYESSGLRFDIRFVPEEMEFESERIREEILSDNFSADWYRPRRVGMHTLTASNPKISWEADDPERLRSLKRAFDEEAKLEDYEAFIASGTDDDEDNESQRNAKREVLLAAAREGIVDSGQQQIVDNIGEADGSERQLLTVHKDMVEEGGRSENRGDEQCDGEDREISDADSEEEAVEVRRPKSKTKFKVYLERKKQLKQERNQEEAKQRKRRRNGGDEEEVRLRETETIVAHRFSHKENYDNSMGGGMQISTEKTLPSNVDQVESDGRFTAFFTDSTFAVDRTSAHYKGGNLADRQAKEKQKRRGGPKKA